MGERRGERGAEKMEKRICSDLERQRNGKGREESERL